MRKQDVKLSTFIFTMLFAIVVAISSLGIAFMFQKDAYAGNDDDLIIIDDSASSIGSLNLSFDNERIFRVDIQDDNIYAKAKDQLVKFAKYTKQKWSSLEAYGKQVAMQYGMQAASSINSMIFDAINNDGAVDYLKHTANFLKNSAAMAATIYSGSPMVGQSVSSGFDMFFQWFHLYETSQSEIQILESKLNDQFDRISEEIDDVKRQVADLAEQLDEEINQVLNKIDDSFEAYYAKSQVTDFIYSTSGNFSYNLLRKYLYGSSESGLFSNLATSVAKKQGDEEIRKQYNSLYKALMKPTVSGESYLNMFTEYYVESSARKSISQH